MDIHDFYNQKRKGLLSDLVGSIINPYRSTLSLGSDLENKANQVLLKAKEEVFADPNYSKEPFEVNSFSKVKSIIEKTQLFSILKKMPKGALLHAHHSSIGDYEQTLKFASTYEKDSKKCYYKTSSNKKLPLFKLSEEPINGYILLKNAMESQKAEVLSHFILDDSKYNTSVGIWRNFDSLYPNIGDLFDISDDINAEFFKQSLTYLSKEDHVSHLELRSNWDPNFENKENTFENVMISTANSLDNFSFRIILATSRSKHKKDSLLEEFICTKGKQIRDKVSPYMVGLDFQGEEDTGKTAQEISRILLDSFSKLGNYLPPFYFHDGESSLPSIIDSTTPNSKLDFNHNLIDAYLLNTLNYDGFKQNPGRVGHALELVKETFLLELFKRANIAIEICPVSNHFLKYVRDIREHPAITYLSYGLPITINSDDPSIFGYQGITHDFWMATVGWGLDFSMLKILCYQSLLYSSLDSESKKKKINHFLEDWNRFLKQIIS